MVGRRLALVIANGEYENPGLQALRSPSADAAALVQVLTDPSIASFEVDVLTDGAAHEVMAAVDDRLSDTKPDDLVLVHFSGHGLKDESGALYLAARNTRPERLSSTAVPAEFLQRVMDGCRARRLVLLLDCCFGGAFGRGVRVRAAGSANVLEAFPLERAGGGRGRAVISASSSMEFALEGSRLANDKQSPSLFTHAVVEGMRSGDADLDGDGLITLDELYDYVFDKVREQNPRQSPTRRMDLEGDLVLARTDRREVARPVDDRTDTPGRTGDGQRGKGSAPWFVAAGLVSALAALLTLAVLFLPWQYDRTMVAEAQDLLPVTILTMLLMGLASAAALAAVRRQSWQPVALGLGWAASALAAVFASTGWWIQMGYGTYYRSSYHPMPVSLRQGIGLLAVVVVYLVTRAAWSAGIFPQQRRQLLSAMGIGLMGAGALGATGLVLQFIGYGSRSYVPAAYPLLVAAALAFAVPTLSAVVTGLAALALRLGWAIAILALVAEALIVLPILGDRQTYRPEPADDDLFFIGIILLAASLLIMLLLPPIVRIVSDRLRRR